MKKQTQPDSRHTQRNVRTIVQASVALIILTVALWIGWWPDFAAVPAATGSSDYFNKGQSSTQFADDRMLDQLGQETSYMTINSLSRGSQLPISEEIVITSASLRVRSIETEQVTTTTSTSTIPDLFAQWQFPLKVEPYTPGQGVFGADRTSKRLHAGIDLYAPDGTEVFAMTGGKVSQIYLFYESLLAIEVENDDGTTIRYTELTPLVKVGDRVEQGQLIARLKQNSSGSCMLHLEIYATVGTGSLTQVNNKTYLYVPMRTKSYMRRSDLVDPGAVYQLPRP